MNWDRVITSSPINADAAKAASGGGEQPREFKSSSSLTSRTPLPMLASITSGIDYTGHKRGRLTVVGLLDKRKAGVSGEGGRWVVRCACGLYEVRRAAFLLRGDEADCMCSVCRNRRRMLNGFGLAGTVRMAAEAGA